MHSSCEADCQCSCHSYSRRRTWKFLEPILGSLFIGYHATPWPFKACDDSRCQSASRRTVCTFAFPSWLLRRSVAVTMSNQRPRGPELQFRMMRLRDLSSASIFAVLSGLAGADAVSEVQRQLKEGETSVYDIVPGGRSILLVSYFISTKTTPSLCSGL